MKCFNRMTWIAVLAMGLALACSDDTETTKLDKGTPDKGILDKGTPDKGTPDKSTTDTGKTDKSTTDTGKTDTGATTTVTLSGSFINFGSTTAATGVEVAIKDNTAVTKATSGSDGKWTLTNVPDVDSLITMTKTGSYYPFIGMYYKGQTLKTYDNTSLLTPALVSTMLLAVGSSAKSGKGHVIFTSSGTSAGVAGTSITISPTGGEGPYYLSAAGIPDKTLTSTSAAARAFLLNLDPGDYTVTFTNSSKTCTLLNGWKGTTSTTLKVRVVADAATIVSALCQ